MTRPRYATGARTLLLSTGLALCTAMAAQASTFSWDFSGTVGTPDGSNYVGQPAPNDFVATGFTFTGADTSILTWGNQAATGGGNPLSSLSIIASTGSTGPLTSGVDTQVQIGSISWRNTSVFGSGGNWDTVLSFDLILGSVTGAAELTVRVNNTEDPNGNPATNNASGLAPDVISFLSFDLTGLPPLSFGVGDNVLLTGFSAGLMNPGQCGTNNPNSTGSTLIGDNWTNCEGNTSVIGLYANVRYDAPPPPSVIPLPAAGWLLLGGLAGLGALRARRRTAA